LEGQSQAGLQMDSPKIQSIRVANNPGASEENSSSVKFDSLDPSRLTLRADLRSLHLTPAPALDCGQKTSGAPEALSLDTSATADFVFLAFGQIRDGKNLDLFLRAMTHLPKHVKLLAAGKGDSGSSRPPEFYQNLAEELGVADRCRWDIRRIPEDEVGDIFAACDLVLVTYSAKFRSASGVLNAAVSARKPVLASSGAGPLKTVVEKYHLGVFVKPDDQEEILRAASELATRNQVHATLAPAWDRYERENSWVENAGRVIQELKEEMLQPNNLLYFLK
jgi:glycosyltransferase involved in cell wall biosynthesis